MDRAKVVAGLEEAITEATYPDRPRKFMMSLELAENALELLKSQNEIIDDLLKVGYPHNFQREEPWIVNYMYAITDVIRKAVNLKNDAD